MKIRTKFIKIVNKIINVALLEVKIETKFSSVETERFFLLEIRTKFIKIVNKIINVDLLKVKIKTNFNKLNWEFPFISRKMLNFYPFKAKTVN